MATASLGGAAEEKKYGEEAEVSAGAAGENDVKARRRLLILCAVALPWRTHTYPGKKGRPQSTVHYIIRDSLKFKTRDADEVAKVLEYVDSIARMAGETDASAGPDRVAAGLALRDMKFKNGRPLWRFGVRLACVAEMQNLRASDDAAVIGKYRRLEARICDMGLDGVWDMAPLMDGNELQRMLGTAPKDMDRNSRCRFKDLIHEQTRWQLENPDGDIELCKAHLADWWQREVVARLVDGSF